MGRTPNFRFDRMQRDKAKAEKAAAKAAKKDAEKQAGDAAGDAVPGETEGGE